ncbi:MAG: intradiol ring-cleavage dioxygenase, partial [Steroidobacteraceae bacterium]
MKARRPTEHDHPHGLQFDLETLARRNLEQRRRALGWLLSSGAVALVTACGGGDGSSSTATTATGTGTGTGTGTTASCMADPEETQGPYPADGSNTVNGTATNVLTESGI